ncbi:BgTH12-00585, partial [Blumeria graminis f. sp. triticale]
IYFAIEAKKHSFHSRASQSKLEQISWDYSHFRESTRFVAQLGNRYILWKLTFHDDTSTSYKNYVSHPEKKSLHMPY